MLFRTVCACTHAPNIPKTSALPRHMTAAVPPLVSSSCSVISLRGCGARRATHLMETFQYRVQSAGGQSHDCNIKKKGGGGLMPEAGGFLKY